MRTKNSFKNILSTVMFNLVVGLLGFLKVKVFVNGLSTDVYSLNQLFYQIFGYIAIADIGFGLLINQKLYWAFSKKDRQEVVNIYSTSKKFYNFIGTFMFAVAFIISFFVFVFTKAKISPLYIQVVFILFIIRNVVEYFFVAPKYVLEADQKSYKINYLVKSIKIIETIIEIILVLMDVDYMFILIPGIIITIIMNIYINNKIYKMYDWLKDNKTFNKKYLKGTEDVIYQKLSGLVNSNTNVILLSTFIDPLSVVIYTTYTYITKFITDTIYLIATAITPSYANVVCKESSDKSYNVFTEINILFLFITSFITIMLYGFLNSLIILWVGKNYVVNQLTLFFFCLTTFQVIAERPLAITVNSKGLFKETKRAAILEAIINLILSILLIFKYGIMGVLIGSVIAKFLTYFIDVPIYIYKHIFNKKFIYYYLNYFIAIATTILFIIGFNYLNPNVSGIISWLLNVIFFAVIISIILFSIYLCIFKSFRNLVRRGIEFIKVKGQYSE